MKSVPDVPSCSTEGGNTKTPSVAKCNPAIRWVFTLNNYTDDECDQICSICSSFCKFCIIGKEVGELGTPHLQGYIELKTKSRPLTVFNFTKRISWSKARGNREQNVTYCSKDNIFFSIGLPKPLKKLACEDNFYEWQLDILNILKNEPNDRDIYWYRGRDGNDGKTTFAKYLVRFHEAIILGGKSADMKNGIIEYSKTNGGTPSLIVLNIPKSFNSDYLSYTGIEEVKDMLFYSGKYEGGMIDGNPPHLIVFSNSYPDINKCSKDRWQIYDIKDNKAERVFCDDIDYDSD